MDAKFVINAQLDRLKDLLPKLTFEQEEFLAQELPCLIDFLEDPGDSMDASSDEEEDDDSSMEHSSNEGPSKKAKMA